MESNVSPMVISVKRLFDIAGAVCGLLLTWPIILAATLAARWDTGKSGIFHQTRVGLHGRNFRLKKIRTMRDVPCHTSTVTTRDDLRVTTLGRVFRSTKIDELPQLWNVLRGTMSLVGPRPTTASDYLRMSPHQRKRCSVLPGMTGLAQIRGNTTLTWPARIAHDLEYVADHDVWMDINILATTAWLVVAGQAATDPPTEDEWGQVA